MLKQEFHFNDLPEDIFVELNQNFCEELCRTAIKTNDYKSKSNLGKFIGVTDWKARKLWNKTNRFTIEWLEKLRNVCYLQNPVAFSIENIEKKYNINRHSRRQKSLQSKISF